MANNLSKCSSCGAIIIWIKAAIGKHAPCNPNLEYYIPDPAGKELLMTADGEVRRGRINDRSKEG